MKQGKLTRNAKAFMAANAKSGVVEGSVPGPQGGATYRLKDGSRFTLNVSECNAAEHAGGILWYGMAHPTLTKPDPVTR